MAKCDSRMLYLLLYTILIVPEGSPNEIRNWKVAENEININGYFSRDNSFHNSNTVFDQEISEVSSSWNRHIRATQSQLTNRSMDIFNSTYHHCEKMCGNFSRISSSDKNVNTSFHLDMIQNLSRLRRTNISNVTPKILNSINQKCRKTCENFGRKINFNKFANTSVIQKDLNVQDRHLESPRSSIMNKSVTLSIFNSSYKYCESNTTQERIIYFTSFKNCGIKSYNVTGNITAIFKYLKIYCKVDDNFIQSRNETSIKNLLCFIDFGNGENYTLSQNASNNSALSTNNIIEQLCTSMKSYFRNEKRIIVALKTPTCPMGPETISCCVHHLALNTNILAQSEEALQCWMKTSSLISVFIEISYIISFIALMLIFLTEIVSKKFRSERGNQLLVHFAFSIFVVNLLDIYMCSLTTFGVWFQIGSIAYQYFSLVESCWTSIIAFLQYKRYVKVLDVEPKNFMLKLCAIAYCSPISLVVVKQIYHHSTLDYVIYSTFWVPALISLSINTVFLVLITRNILCVRPDYIEQKRSLSMEVKLIFFLFFILDFSWCFIILFHLTLENIFADIFLIIHSLQGFMLLLVFGLLNKHNRLIYKNFITSNISRFWKQNYG